MIHWEIKKFIKVILSIQVLFLFFAFLQTPIFLQVIGFIYLSIIPGILILRLLKYKKMFNVEIILYSVGLSISFVIFLGLIMNFFYPLLGIYKPISNNYLILTISISVVILCVLNYIFDINTTKNIPMLNINNESNEGLDTSLLLSIILIFLFIFLSITGTYFVNVYNYNLLLYILLFMISFMPLIISYNKIPERLYIFIIFGISLSILYHQSLITDHIWGWDIHGEYYFANLIKSNSLWDVTVPSRLNAMLSIVMLAPIYSLVCNINLINVYKLFYPLLYSLVPIGLYLIFKKQTDNKIAFYASYLFMSFFQFYRGTLQQIRVQLAEYFLVLIILLIVSNNLKSKKNIFLFLIFSISLITSHYGLSILYMLSLILIWAILRVRAQTDMINLKYVMLYIIFALSWYIYISNSTIFITIVNIGKNISSNLFLEFLNPETTQGLKFLTTKLDPVREIQRILHLISQFLIVIGLLSSSFFKRALNENNKFTKEFLLFSFINLGILFACLLVPRFARQLNTNRFYHFSLLFLAPFSITGGITIMKLLSKIFKIRWSAELLNNSLRIFSIFLLVYLLFNSGFVNEVVKARPSSFALNKNMDYPLFNSMEIYAARWVADKTETLSLYGDLYGYLLLHEFDYWRVRVFSNRTKRLSPEAYVFFRTLNVKGKLIESQENQHNIITLEEWNLYNETIKKMNKIFDNGGAHIYSP